MKNTCYILLLFLSLSSTVLAKTERVEVQGHHGKLVADLQLPDQMKKHAPLVILCHGLTANRNGALLRLIADSLEARGIASLRFDFNAHGESEGLFEKMTIPNEIEDARNVVRWAEADGRFGRIGLMGHSQGGVVASMLAGQLGKKVVRALALYAPAASIRDNVISGSLLGASHAEADPLDPPEYVELWGKHIGREYITSAFWLPIYETAALYKGPVCIVHGTADRLVPFTYGLRFHQMWRNSEYHQMERFDHGFSQDLPRAAQMAVDFFSARL